VSRRAVGLILAALAAAVVFWLWPRGPKDPEQQIRALVAKIVQGAEARDLGPLSDAMADNFKGPQGANKQEVKQLVMYHVLRNQENVAVFNPSLTVKLLGKEDAEIEGVFLFARTKAKSAEELQPDMVASAYTITAVLTKEGNDWKFTSATYAPATWP